MDYCIEGEKPTPLEIEKENPPAEIVPEATSSVRVVRSVVALILIALVM